MDNKVELLGYYGDDSTHACSAWTSTYRELTPEKITRIPALLKSLADAGHHTVFEKSSLHFLVDSEIASHIHMLKHRIGVSINGESARYKELKEGKMYIPKDWNGVGVSNPTQIANFWGQTWADVLENYTTTGNTFYHKCLEDLTPILGRKRAKETARFFKTYNSQIQVDIMFNWRSFVHFLNLRMSEHAQLEIREIANEMLKLVKNIDGNPFEHTIVAFGL